MGNRARVIVMIVLGCVLTVAAGAFVVGGRGFSARDEPWAIESLLARAARRLATPRGAYDAVNPLPLTSEVLAEARSHFADHCAVCHGNDGGGDTQIGRNLYPKAPDMRAEPTQSLTDGELFYIITNGIRLTGMPAWGSGDAADDHGSWGLVHFIRHLPRISEEELLRMEELNPVSRSQLAAEKLEREFLEGGPPPKRDHHHH